MKKTGKAISCFTLFVFLFLFLLVLPASASAKCRALLIGEQRFLWFDDESDPDSGFMLDDMDQRNVGDVLRMAETLEHTVGIRGPLDSSGEAFQITRKFNLSWTELRNVISDTFSGTTDQDLSVIFIATHGDETGDGDLRMAFTGDEEDPEQVRDYWEHRYLPFNVLASWLTASVKGRVFVILESCGSGSSIYKNTLQAGKKKTGQDMSAADGFTARAVKAFAAEDPGIPAAAPENSEGPSLRKSTGDLRLPKYYVLAAAQHHEMSYGWETFEEETSFNFFTKWLIRGIGRKDHSPADTNHDNYLTLNEMYSYVSQYNTITYEGYTFSQHVQCYPENNDDKLLKLEESETVFYDVTDVRGDSHTIRSGKNAVITVKRNISDEVTYGNFTYVEADGIPIDPGHYLTAEGSLILTLKSGYLDTLPEGDHTVIIHFTDGEAETALLIKKSDPTPTLEPVITPTPTPEPTPAPRPVPKTGDTGRPALSLLLLLLSGLGLFAFVLIRKKQR